MKTNTLCFAIAAACLALPAAAQEGGDPDEEIVVTGERAEEADAVRDQVQRLVDTNRADLPAKRYFDPFCVSVNGLNAAGNSYIRDRIAGHAERVGLMVQGEVCRPNALLIVHDEPASIVNQIMEEAPGLLPREERNGVEVQVRAGSPIIVWYNEEPRSQGGRPMAHDDLGLMSYSTRRGDNSWPSRTQLGYSLGIVSGVVILDGEIVEGMEIDRLADYAAMRLLAPGLLPPQDGVPRPSTIVAPFPLEEGAQMLTRFDRAYLQGLYSLQPNAPQMRLVQAVAEAYAEE